MNQLNTRIRTAIFVFGGQNSFPKHYEAKFNIAVQKKSPVVFTF